MNIHQIINFFLDKKKTILILLVAFNVFCSIALLNIRNEFKSTSYLQINNFTQKQSSNSFGVSSFLQDATLSDSAALASQYLNTKDFIYKKIDKYNLGAHFYPDKKILNEEDYENLFDLLKRKIIFAPVKDLDSIFTFSFQSYDRKFSQDTLKNIILDLNNDLSQLAISTSKMKIDYVLEQLGQSTNQNLIDSFSNLLDEEVKKNTLASAMPNSYIFEIVGLPDMPIKRSYPGSRFLFLLLLNFAFVFAIIFYILLKDIYKVLKDEK